MMGSIMNLVISAAQTGDFDRMMSREHQNANIIIWCKDHKGTTIREVVKRAREWIEESKDFEKVEFKLASGYLGILAAVNEVVAAAQAQNMALILLLMIVTTTICYRSFVAALMLLVPLTLANFLTMVVMVMNEISLNINTIPVASIGIGVGVDYAIYILSRICEEYQVHRDYNKAIPIAIRTTGKAVFFTATTLVGGVIFWFFLSSLRFQAEMGLLLSLLMLINMFLALGLLPAMVYVFKPRFVGEAKMLIREK
jgi:predicted RND superfamily exporter protein